MKPTSLIILCIIALSLSACKESTKKNPNTETSPVETAVSIEESSSNTITINDAEFKIKVADYINNTQEWKYLGDKPAIVDFYATWCKPCKELNPILEEIAAEYKDQIYVYKVDIDKNKELAGAFAVQAVPTLFFIPMQGNPSVAKGGMTKEQFQQYIKDVLLNPATDAK